MTATNYREIAYNGLWRNNPALVQLLGLCPLLAVSSSVVSALGMGLATTVVFTGSNAVVSLIRNKVNEAIRLPAFIMIIAAFTTCVELLMQAFAYELYQVLGLFISLIVTNCAVLGRADAFASRNTIPVAAADGFMMGLGFTLILVLLGAIRELTGTGLLFANMHLLFGDVAKDWAIHPIEGYTGILLAVLPPGAFLCTGLLIAGKNVIDKRRAEHAKTDTDLEKSPPRRVRTTGNVA